MIDSLPPGPGETSSATPSLRGQLLVDALCGTPWEAEAVMVAAGQAPAEVEADLNSLLDAGVNFYHARGSRDGGPLPERAGVVLDGVLAGQTADKIVRAAQQRGQAITEESDLVNQMGMCATAVRSLLSLVSSVDESLGLARLVKHMHMRTEEMMEAAGYDAKHDLHVVLGMLAANASPHPADSPELERDTQLLRHRFSDTAAAPPLPLITPATGEALAHLARRYEQWVRYAGVSPEDASRQLVERLLAGGPDARSFRQILAENPERAAELRQQLTTHLQDVFISIATAPPDKLPPVAKDGGKAEGKTGGATRRAGRAAGGAALGKTVAKAAAPTAKPAAKTESAREGSKKAEPPKPPRQPKEKPKVRDDSMPINIATAFALLEGDFELKAARATRKTKKPGQSKSGAAAEADSEALEAAEDGEGGPTIAGKDVWEEDGAYATEQDERAPTTDSLRAYLRKIGKYPLLAAEEEVLLAMAIEAGVFAGERLDSGEQLDGQLRRDLVRIRALGERALDMFINSNLRLVVSIAKRYTGRGMAFLDLIQEGNLGLHRAAKKFDYTKGYKFSTYATWWVRQMITRAMADQARIIRIPMHMVETINKLNRIERALMIDLGREPTPEELAKEMNITPAKVLEIQQYTREPASLDAPVGDGDSTLGDLVAIDNEAGPDTETQEVLDYARLRQGVNALLCTLTQREQEVARLRFGLDDGQSRTLEEIAQILSLSRERIRQIEKKLQEKLKPRAGHLRDFLWHNGDGEVADN